MAKLTSQTFNARRNTYGRASLQCDTGTAPGNLTMGGYGGSLPTAARLVLIMDDAASGYRFKLELRPEEVVRLATIILGPVLADLAEEARANLAKVVK